VVKVALPTAAALGAGAGVAIGASAVGGGVGNPGANGTLTACYVHTPSVTGTTPPYGQLRVIDPTVTASGTPPDVNSCAVGESTVTWNTAGPQGPVGPQGPAGAAGAGGTQGAAGTPLIGETSFALKNTSGKTFLKLDGISGESTDSKHKGEIELQSFSLASGGGSHASGGGGSAGKVHVQSFVITKVIDKASPMLFKAAGEGKHINGGVITFARKAGKGQQEYLKIKLTDILVSSYKSGVNGGSKPSEELTFTFQKANETFYDPKGQKLGSVSFKLSPTS
jgi:type VI secretion system secreted protein Hcp